MNAQMQAALYHNRQRRKGRPIGSSRAPTVNDDVTKGYTNGTRWHDGSTGKLYSLTANTAGAADWDEVV